MASANISFIFIKAVIWATKQKGSLNAFTIRFKFAAMKHNSVQGDTKSPAQFVLFIVLPNDLFMPERKVDDRAQRKVKLYP